MGRFVDGEKRKYWKKIFADYYWYNTEVIFVFIFGVLVCLFGLYSGSESKYLPKLILVTCFCALYLVFVFVRSIFKTHRKF
ncbi:hypothetical protein LP7551_02099 [Roseibium album]|nr:hypothetical protein LP7551_02099 [Roseibium album]